MTTKILFFTDTHAKTKTPTRRSGNFERDVVEKFAWICMTAQRERADMIVHGGDLFDGPHPSYRLAANIMRLIAATGIPWYQVLGNHDILGHNPETYKTGVFSFFEQLPNFEILNRIDVEGWTLKGVHYRHGIEEKPGRWGVPNERTIQFAHAMIVPSQVPFIHVLPQKVPTKARIVFCGHYHDPWGNAVVREQMSNNTKKQFSEGLTNALSGSRKAAFQIDPAVLNKVTLFLNPGSMSRIAALAHNLRRTPRALLLHLLDDDNGVALESVPIQVARPPEEVFSEEEIAEDKAWEGQIQNFLAAMENTKVEGVNASTLVINAAKARGHVQAINELEDDEREVLEYALEIVGRLESRGA